MTTDTVVEVRDLRKVYRGGAVALRGLDFDIHRGETFARPEYLAARDFSPIEPLGEDCLTRYLKDDAAAAG